jgi:hypothetical protein
LCSRSLINRCCISHLAMSAIRRESHLPDGGPPLTPYLRGTICRLADRPCPLDIRRGLSGKLPWLVRSSSPPSLAPIDIIETDRLCVPPSLDAFRGSPLQDPGVDCDGVWPTGVLNESAERWPVFGGEGLGLRAELVLTCGDFLCLSPPDAKPLAADGCSDAFDGAGTVAIFLKVIWHSISSPAKTVCSVHCTKTLMLVDCADISMMGLKLLLCEGERCCWSWMQHQ